MKRILLFALALCGPLAAGQAESLQAAAPAASGDAPAPRPSYLAPVPAWGHWTVTFKYPASPAAASADPKAAPDPSASLPASIETVRTGATAAITVASGTGATQAFYQQGGWTVTSTPQGPQLLASSPTQPPYPYYAQGFTFLDGVEIGPRTFKEAGRRGGVSCLHYADKGVEAWIAADTMLPVAVRNADGVEAAYQFLPPPTKPAACPSDQAALLQKEQAAYQYTRALH